MDLQRLRDIANNTPNLSYSTIACPRAVLHDAVDELTLLREDKARLLEALEFYASVDNWTSHREAFGNYENVLEAAAPQDGWTVARAAIDQARGR